ncbi:uncharacterized protein [Rutidosis leptorrhynchoides]|uniref:uncharacterized protein n=1 Tax=Rutidosis leptorrhynchoides TaxID=125765 RepID=UPI003A9982B4
MDIKEINVENGRSDVIIAFDELLQLKNLEKIHAKRCELLRKIFEVELEVTDSKFNNESQTIVVKLPKLREVVLEELENLNYLWKNNKWRQLELPNLTRLSIHNCNWLDDVFATSMVSTFMQLQELHVTHCRFIKVIVHKDDDFERIVLPCLKSLKLEHLRYMKGFCLWEKEFLLPSLSTLVIKQKVIETNEGFIDIGEQDINSFIITNKQQGRHFGSQEDE